MTFGRPFGGARAPVAASVVIASAAVILACAVVMGMGVLPAEARREREIPMELAAVAGGTAPVRLSAHEVVVSVGASGEVRLGGSALTVEALEERLTQLAAEAGETALTVRADERCPFGLVARIFAAGRKAGIREVALLTVAPPGVPQEGQDLPGKPRAIQPGR